MSPSVDNRCPCVEFGKLEFVALPCKNVLFLLRQEKNQKNAAQEGASAACSRTPIPPLLRTSPRTWVRWKNISDFGLTAPKPCRIHRKCAPGGVLRGGGFVCGSKQLNASPKLSSLPTFLFSDKKVGPPAGTGSPDIEKSKLSDKLKFEALSAVPVELTTQGSIDVEPGW